MLSGKNNAEPVSEAIQIMPGKNLKQCTKKESLGLDSKYNIVRYTKHSKGGIGLKYTLTTGSAPTKVNVTEMLYYPLCQVFAFKD